MSQRKPLVRVRPKRPLPVLLCGKCLKRADKAGKLWKALAKEVKNRSEERGLKRPKLVTTRCLGICPKHAVVAASVSTLRNGEYVLLGDKTAAADAARILMATDDV